MSSDPSQAPGQLAGVRERIVDVVFGSAGFGRRRRTLGVAFVVALLTHGALGLLALRVEPSLESWSANLALRVHSELSREQIVELPEPAPPPDPPKPAPATPPPPPSPARQRVPQSQPRSPAPTPPAQAGAILARDPDPSAPLDLTGNTFVTGSATAYAGGVTTSGGTNPHAVTAQAVTPAPPARPPGPDHSSPIQLPNEQWRCPWPPEADDEQINEQTAVIRVIVGADGAVESASVVQDPGHGFGRAALACARAARFSPARDRSGTPIRTQSPPIRVRFTR